MNTHRRRHAKRRRKIATLHRELAGLDFYSWAAAATRIVKRIHLIRLGVRLDDWGTF